jgi:hypothetical protein
MLTSKILNDACAGKNLSIFLEKIQGKKLQLADNATISLERVQSFGGTNDTVQIKSKVLFSQKGIIFEQNSDHLLRTVNCLKDSDIVLQLRHVQERCFYVCDSMYFAKLIKEKTIQVTK